MGRYAVTLVFEVGDGKMPRGADVLERMHVGKKAVHRFSYCDGRSLTVVVDWSAGSAEQASTEAALASRLLWTQITGADPGEPLSSRTRPLTPPPLVSAGLGAALGRRMRRRGPFDPSQAWSALPPVESWWLEGPDDDDGGLAGVREPRRPKPTPPPLARTLDEPPIFLG
jgi:hypothetical protein